MYKFFYSTWKGKEFYYLLFMFAALLYGKLFKVYSDSFLFNCMTVGQASDSMTALTLSFNSLVGAWCLSLAGPTIAQLEASFSSDYL